MDEMRCGQGVDPGCSRIVGSDNKVDGSSMSITVAEAVSRTTMWQ